MTAPDITTKKKILRYIAFFAILSLPFLTRDYTPNNELKYISIAREAIDDGTFFAFHNHGEAYADKPPLYMWAVMASTAVAGNDAMMPMSLLSVLPCIIIMLVMSRWIRRERDDFDDGTFDMLCVTTGYMLASALVMRMDMLMAMFITLALHTFYKLYTGCGRRRDKWLLPLYIFLALFTKGPVGLLMPIAVIAAFLAWERKFKTIGSYLGWRQWAVIAALCAVWFGATYAEGGNEYLHNLLFRQTVGRGINSFHHAAPWYFYLLRSPMTFAPWSILYLVLAVCFTATAVRKRSVGRLEKFFITAVVATFAMLTAFSSKIDIYLLPIYPFVVALAAMWLPRYEHNRWVKVSASILAAILIALPAALAVAPRFTDINLSYAAVWGGAAVAAAFGIAAITAMCRDKVRHSIRLAAWGLLALLAAVSPALPHFNAYMGWGDMAQCAQQTADEHHIDNWAYYRFRGGRNIDVYSGCEVRRCDSVEELQHLEKGCRTTGCGCIVIVRERDCSRDTALAQWAAEHPSEQTTDFRIVIIK